MKELGILAASWISQEGYGNDLTGMTCWPTHVAQALERGELEALRWNTLFTSEMLRFGRMDLMSRLGLMAVELLGAPLAILSLAERDTVGVCVETGTGCVVTDTTFLQTPLASTFAYTLPSTVLGEICIRHRFRGPVLCLLPLPEQDGVLETARGWLEREEAGLCVCVACDLLDKRIAPQLRSLHDVTVGGWECCAVLIGWRTGASREHAWQSGRLSRLARRLCTSNTTRPTTASK
jgi:hypothetical protein